MIKKKKTKMRHMLTTNGYKSYEIDKHARHNKSQQIILDKIAALHQKKSSNDQQTTSATPRDESQLNATNLRVIICNDNNYFTSY